MSDQKHPTADAFVDALFNDVCAALAKIELIAKQNGASPSFQRVEQIAREALRKVGR